MCPTASSCRRSPRPCRGRLRVRLAPRLVNLPLEGRFEPALAGSGGGQPFKPAFAERPPPSEAGCPRVKPGVAAFRLPSRGRLKWRWEASGRLAAPLVSGERGGGGDRRGGALALAHAELV